MKIIKFAEKHLGEFKIQGKEVKVKKCPFCGREKSKFFINTEKEVYQCFSGSCKATGHVSKLYEKFNEDYIRTEKKKAKKEEIAKYVRRTTKEVIEFLEKRGISKKTVNNNFFDIMSTKQNEVSFIYRKKFEVHSIKVRSTTEKRFRGKKIKALTLWKLDFTDNAKPLIITEGEIDQLSFEEQGIQNAVSVPAGANSLSWIDTDFEELEQFKEIILAFDNDEAGNNGANAIAKRLPETAIVKRVDFQEFKDANEVLLAGVNLQGYIDNATEMIDDYILKMKNIEVEEDERYSTGIRKLNRSTGGIKMGELNIWTGTPGSGKSTILNQIMLNVMQQGINSLIYTPELSDGQYKEWSCRQLLDTVKGKFDVSHCNIREKDVFTIKKSETIGMSNWIDTKLVNITGNKKQKADQLLIAIKKSIRKNNVKMIVIDNLMKIMFDDDINPFKAHKDFVNNLSEITKKYKVSINLVAHPKKHDQSDPDQYDISGTSDIPNLVDNIYYCKRITDRALKDTFKKDSNMIIAGGYQTAIMCLKSRSGEETKKWRFYCFDRTRKSIHSEKDVKEIIKWSDEVEKDDEFYMF